MKKKKQALLTRMRGCAQLVLATIRVGENSKISSDEYFSAQNAIDALFVLWGNHHDQTFSDCLKEEVHRKLTHVFENRPKRKDIFDHAKIERLFDLILKETESPRNRGLFFYIALLISHHSKILQIDVPTIWHTDRLCLAINLYAFHPEQSAPHPKQ